ncbi:MAG: hypothetical protein AAB792_01050 [Patescibacteria group bacterium]
MEQAEKVESEYPKNQQAVREPSPFSGILGLLGISGQNEPQPAFDPALIDSILEGTTIVTNDVSVPVTSSATPLPIPLTSLTPSPTPSVTLLPSPTPFISGGGGGGGGGGNSQITFSLHHRPTQVRRRLK